MTPGNCFDVGFLSYTSTTCIDACNLLTGNVYYCSTSQIELGSFLCTDSECTISASAGYYSDYYTGGTSCYELDSYGFVISISTCYSTPTPTPTITPTITPTLPLAVQFRSCEDGSVFRYKGSLIPTTEGYTYYIQNSKEYTGCATVIPYSGTGLLYDSEGVTFTSVIDCADGLCPRTNLVSAVLSNCGNGDIKYFLVDEDTAYVGATYVYGQQCYSFIKFGGTAEIYLGSPKFRDCLSCAPEPTPSPTKPFRITPSVTPSPSPCNVSGFCLRTTNSSLSGYSGYYSSTELNYNYRLYYSGDGQNYGVIYYTGTKWCLSDSLGGDCLMYGKEPCYSSCPDLSNNVFSSGVCPTPTPSFSSCTVINFEAYFDCEYNPPITPTPSIPCNDVDFTIFSTPGMTTPTPTPQYITGVEFNIFVMSQTPTSSITPTPTPTSQEKIKVFGSADFNFVDKKFENSLTNVLIDCSTGEEYYVGDQLYTGTTNINTGTILSISINTPQGQKNICVTYDRVVTNISPNTYINQINGIFGYCTNCST